jgi:hypothetical protein
MLSASLLAAPPAAANDSLTIATYNTHLVPDTLRCAEQVDIDVDALIAAGIITMLGGALVIVAMTVPQALQLADCMALDDDVAYREAGPIAAEILRQNFDVVALNEVFDEDARDRLVTDLSGIYTHRVEYINSGPDLEDSGLMLFSKFPIGNLANPDAVFRDGTVHATTDQVAFVEYNDAANFDQLSSKGAAFVKILNPRPNAQIRAWDVVFTHMQAAYDADDEYSDVRKEQFDDIQELVRRATEGGEKTPLFILGDLNIEGEWGWWEPTLPDAVVGSNEWKDFARDAFADPGATDAWATTTSLLDVGITNHAGALGDMRLDYILNTEIEAGPCIQHMRLGYLGNSDHIAVVATTNRLGTFCNPRSAWQNPPLDTHLRNPSGSGDLTRIEAPGAMQWYLVELPEDSSGVAIGTTRPFDPITGAGVRVELFASHDLSAPIKPTSTETFVFGEVVTQKYLTPRTFYVRVFSPTPLWTGEYDLFLHQLTCASREEACPLQVNDARRYDLLFVPDTRLGDEDTAWFDVHITDRADSGKPQTVKVFADEFDDDLLDAELVSRTGIDPPLNNQLDDVAPGHDSISGNARGPLSFYLAVRRHDMSRGTRFRVGWQSNLTRLGGSEIGLPGARSAVLVCDDETNGAFGSEAGEDEISLLVRVDKTAFREIVYHEYNCNSGGVQLNIDKQLGTIRFIDEVVLTLYERDDGTIINPDDESQWIIHRPLPLEEFRPSQELPPGDLNQRVKRETGFAVWDFEGGKYHMEYNLSHQVQF